MQHMAPVELPVNTVPMMIVTGQYLAHSKRTKVESAFIAAGMHVGDIQLTFPTIGQSAMLADVSASYVHMAIDCPEGRQELVRTGVIPMRFATLKARPVPVTPEVKLAEVVAAVGVNGAVDMLMKLVEREAA